MGQFSFYQVIIGRNITDRRNPKYWEENRSQCQFGHPKSHRDIPGTKLEPTL